MHRTCAAGSVLPDRACVAVGFGASPFHCDPVSPGPVQGSAPFGDLGYIRIRIVMQAAFAKKIDCPVRASGCVQHSRPPEPPLRMV